MFELFAATPLITFSLDPALVIQLILTVLMPIAVGLVTTRTTSGKIKAWLLAGLTLATSLVTGIGDALASGTSFDIGVALLLAIPAFAISVATYYGLWKPTGVGVAAQDVEATKLFK